MSLQAKLDAFKADFEAGKPPYNVPPSVIETMHRATAELIESGAAQRAKKAGDVAPSFSLKDPEGNVVNSADLLEARPAGSELLPRRLVPVLQYGAAVARSRQGGVRQVQRLAGRDLAADRPEQPQVGAPEQAHLPDPVGRQGQGRGGRIFLQLWHVGRQSHVDLQPNGEAPLAPSAITAEGYAYTKRGEAPFSMPRALELHEIPGIIEEFRSGAERALRAGFDGVEIHGANGYLPDQFLQDGTNKRTDEYGGPIEHRARFLTQAAISAWGADRVGVRISPSGTCGSMSDNDPQATFGYVTTELDRLGIAYLHVVEPRIKGTEEIAHGQAPVAVQHLRPKFSRTVIAAGGFTRESAEAIVASGDADLVAFGRHFIANPDLPERLRRGLPLNRYDRSTFYGGDARGYIDYPAAEVASAA